VKAWSKVELHVLLTTAAGQSVDNDDGCWLGGLVVKEVAGEMVAVVQPMPMRMKLGATAGDGPGLVAARWWAQLEVAWWWAEMEVAWLQADWN
jgi:hypothetical protein